MRTFLLPGRWICSSRPYSFNPQNIIHIQLPPVFHIKLTIFYTNIHKQIYIRFGRKINEWTILCMFIAKTHHIVTSGMANNATVTALNRWPGTMVSTIETATLTLRLVKMTFFTLCAYITSTWPNIIFVAVFSTCGTAASSAGQMSAGALAVRPQDAGMGRPQAT